MSWIPVIPPDKATGKLKQIYDRFPGGSPDNVLTVHSLRPHTLEGHLSLYKNVLHHPGNLIPKWFLEALGTFVSYINGCDYCVAHHRKGIKNNLPDSVNFEEVMTAIRQKQLELAFTKKEAAAFHYAQKLTLHPSELQPGDISDLLRLGWDAGEILEINQVVGYFNYANRTVLGLGVALED